jgi:hypothetical protein
VNRVDESVFWYYLNERYSIYLKRKAGMPKPWTEDPIFLSYKFTNVFREHDRGTTWLRENFLEPHKDDSLGLLAFNIGWYRMFNLWKTGELLGWQTTWNQAAIIAWLTEAQQRGEPVFTGAHIVHSEPGLPKIDSIVDVCSHLYQLTTGPDFVKMCLDKWSMELAFDALKTIKHIGGFMAHEMVQDMAHTRLLYDAIDRNTWTNMGPGAQRGLMRLGLPCKNQKEGLASMVELFERRHQNWKGDVDLELHCIEFALCELSKYAKVIHNEGHPRSTYMGLR